VPAARCYVARVDVSKEKNLLTLSLAKPTQNAEAILKIYELFIYGDIYCITNSFCKNVLKERHISLRRKIVCFVNFPSSSSVHIYFTCIDKYTGNTLA
jgi:hypothetical protein